MGLSQYDDSQTVFEACIVVGSDGRRTDENAEIDPTGSVPFYTFCLKFYEFFDRLRKRHTFYILTTMTNGIVKEFIQLDNIKFNGFSYPNYLQLLARPL